MNPLNQEPLEKMLGQLPRFTRSSAADATFLKKLMAAQPTVSLSTGRPAAYRPFFQFWPRFAYAGAFAVFFLLAAGTFAAYQPTVTRGTLLYPWKQAAERVELAAALTPLQEVSAHVRFSDRRMSEAENIVAQNPTLAWALPVARAHGEEVHLETEAAVNLAETFEDMHREILAASEVVETKMDAPDGVEVALAKIEEAMARHVERLAILEENGPENVKAIVKKIEEAQKNHREKVTRARGKAKDAEEKKEKQFRADFSERAEKAQERATEKLEKKSEPRAQEKLNKRELRTEEKFEKAEEKHEKLDEAAKNATQDDAKKRGDSKNKEEPVLMDVDEIGDFEEMMEIEEFRETRGRGRKDQSDKSK